MRARRSLPPRSNDHGWGRSRHRRDDPARARRPRAGRRDDDGVHQGAPGTGKTAVGLHRAAWLLYAHRARLGRSGVLVIGPNDAFLEHIGAVLPTLGEVEVRHTSIEALTASVPVRATDPTEVARLKGDARMAAVLHRAVSSHLGPPAEAMVVPRGSRRWRVPAHDIAPLVDGLAGREIRYDSARQLLPQRLAHAVLVKMESLGEYPDDRVQDAVARSTPVKAYAASLWPKVDSRRLLHRLLSDPEFLAESADGVLSADEQLLLLWERPSRTAGSVKWTLADTVLLDELGDLLNRTPSLGHVVLDEAQDLSPMQLRAVGRRCRTGAATVLGDIAQGTTPWSTASWEREPGAPGQARWGGVGAPTGVPRAGKRHRVRGAAPAPGRTRARGTRVGA